LSFNLETASMSTFDSVRAKGFSKQHALVKMQNFKLVDVSSFQLKTIIKSEILEFDGYIVL